MVFDLSSLSFTESFIEYPIVVVGAGAGGMATALSLVSRGKKSFCWMSVLT